MWKILNSQPINFSVCSVCGRIVDDEHPFLPFGNPVRRRRVKLDNLKRLRYT